MGLKCWARIDDIPETARRVPLTAIYLATIAAASVSASCNSGRSSFRITPSGLRYVREKTLEHRSHSQKCLTQCPPQLFLTVGAAFALWSHDSHCLSANLKNFPPNQQWKTIGHAGFAHFGSMR